jgi:hypothetical protein
VRPSDVPFRLAAAVLTVAAATGCVSVGQDAGHPGPGRSTGPHGTVVRGEDVAGVGVGGAAGGRRDRKGRSPRPGESKHGKAAPTASKTPRAKPSTDTPGKDGAAGQGGDTGGHGGGGQAGGGGDPAGPTGAPSAPYTPPEPDPTPPPASEPPPDTAEPSASAHEQRAQMVERGPVAAAPVPEPGTGWVTAEDE